MNVVCVDDEALSLQFLERQLNKLDSIDVLATFTNPLEGQQFIIGQEVDVALLDIQMPQIKGIELAEQLLEAKPDLKIVFITAYSSFAVDAFKLNAIDYLVKPIKLDRLQITMERIEKQMSEKEQAENLSIEKLRIKLIPFLAFEDDDEVFKPLHWRTAKSQELFLYLLQYHGDLIEKSSILDILWGEHEIEKAYALLYTTIYNVRKQLKPFHDHIILHNQSDGYFLELRHVEIDVEKWEKELDRLPPVGDLTIDAYEDVMKLNQGTYLANYDYTWLEAERHRLDRLWIHTANEIAAYYVKKDKVIAAMNWYLLVLTRFPTMEEAHFNLMKLYEYNGDFTWMMHQYNELNKMMREEMGAKPSRHIVDWYVSKLK